MGVQGLWELLAPVGRRVSVETLAGKKLAIDASIWMVQFMKAMRDERGEMVRNAHILGFFRRICKLLFLRTKPVFVFDGGTPALKRRTVATRRRHRDNARAKIRKTAEKLLLNHLKAKKLEELAEEIKSSRLKDDDSKGKRVKDDSRGKKAVAFDDDSGLVGSSSGVTQPNVINASNQESLDELLAASLAAEEERKFASNEPMAAGNASFEGKDDDDDEDEEMILPVTSSKIDPTVLASLPPSMQLDLLVQMRERLMAENRQKYQKIKKAPTKFSELQIQSYLKTVAFRREIDEVQKCAAGRGLGGVQTSRIASEANREFIFSSSFTGDKQMLTTIQNNNKDNHALKNKPVISDLLKRNSSTTQSKSTTEAWIGEPARCFGPDVETFFDGSGRVRVSRVRGLGMRMTRDLKWNLDMMKEYEQEKEEGVVCTDPESFWKKEMSKSPLRHSEINHSVSASTSVNGTNETISSNSGVSEPKDKSYPSEKSMLGREAGIQISFPEDDYGIEDTDELFLQLVSGSSTSKLFSENINTEKSMSESESEHIWEEGVVDGKRVNWESEHKMSLTRMKSCEEDEVDWEEGAPQFPKDSSYYQAEHKKSVLNGSSEEEANIQEAIKRSLEDLKKQKSLVDWKSVSCESVHQTSLASLNSCQEDEIDWEEGAPQLLEDSSLHRAEHEKPDLNGSMEEEAKIQEAIKRSLKDLKTQKSLTLSRVDTDLGLFSIDQNLDGPLINNLTHDDSRVDTHKLLESSLGRSSCATTDGLELDYACKKDVLLTMDSPNKHHSPSKISELCLDDNLSFNNETKGRLLVSSVIVDGIIETSHTKNVPGIETRESYFTQKEQSIDTSRQDGVGPRLRIPTVHFADVSSNVNLKTTVGAVHGFLVDADRNESEVSESIHSFGGRHDNGNFQKSSLMEETVVRQETEHFVEKNNNLHTIEEECSEGKSMTQDYLVAEANLDKEISQLHQECVDLGDEQRKLERNAESVSSEMFAECQELLQMFGLPYIIAPMEAEAQCAHMEMSKLVDGVVTDDSDVLLFGARNVYKNIFDDRKYVETYLMKDIESELGLTREQLIQMALLLGSDYTEGISGIGIVNAIEVVHAFPEENGLQKFREWIESPDPTILGKLDSSTASKSKKRSLRASNSNAVELRTNTDEFASEGSASREDGDQPSVDCTPDIREIFMNKHRNVSKNWHIPSSFPSKIVIGAYISPQVDESIDPFSWGKPDLGLLRKLCWEKFGWDFQKADELLVPVLKEYNKHETQLRLEAFYTFNERFAKIRSQRIKKALKGIRGACLPEAMDDLVQEGSKSTRNRRSSPPQEECKHKDSHGKTVASTPPRRQNSDGRGRGRGRGRKGGAKFEYSEARSSTDDSDSRGEMEKHGDVPKVMLQPRKSLRQRKHVKYLEEDAEADKVGVPSNENDRGDGLHEEVATGEDESRKDEEVSSKDYLSAGGGFCMEEGGASIPEMNDSSVETAQGLHAVASIPTGGNSGAPFSELSAMPSLKRRRKKL